MTLKVTPVQKRKTYILLLSAFLLSIIFTSCEHETIPRPRGYFRIDFPEKKYITYKSDCPYTFEFPDYAIVQDHKGAYSKPCWINIIFPLYHAEINVSYLEVSDTNLSIYLKDSKGFAMKHNIKADAIKQSFILNDEKRVFGTKYIIKGNAASPAQFYLTDSTDHFFRGAFYFSHKPNKDSLSPVIDFIIEDIEHLIETFEWNQLEE